MKTRMIVLVITALATALGGAQALSISDGELSGLSWSYTPDSLTDTAGSAAYRTYGSGYAISSGFLFVVVQTNFPEGGALGNDSYTSSTHFSPGDLYLNVGGSFQSGGGSVYGIATTSHANIVQQAYAGQIWDSVTAGKLYQNANFATGTYERYQDSTPGFDPDDGDGNNRVNSYPSFIRYGNEAAGDVSGVRYRATSGSPWAFDIFYKVSLTALGLAGGETIQSFWVMECGNDGTQQFIRNPAVPEPSSIALVLAGVSAFAVRRRSII
jgi:hypothetical protein